MTQDAATQAWRLRQFEAIGSTSDLCRTLALAGEPDGLAVLAARQTSGRGSRGRAWESPAGNLYLSVLLRPAEPIGRAGQWALLTAVSLIEALDGFVPAAPSPCPLPQGEGRRLGVSPPLVGGGRGRGASDSSPHDTALSLKWPNDVLLGGRKLAGILLDTTADTEGGIDWMVIGIGANLAVAPDLPGRVTAAFTEIAAPPLPPRVAEAILGRIAHWRRVRLLDGFAPIRTAWLARAQPVGTHMTLRHAGREFGGTFAGLGEDGSLLLQTGGRVHAFTTGEVLLPEMPRS